MTPPRIADAARALVKGAAELVALSLFVAAVIVAAIVANG